MSKIYRNSDYIYLSYTGFSKLASCPAQYFLEYLDGQRPEVEDERNTIVGNALHWLLEQYIKRGDEDVDFIGRNSDVGFDKVKSEAKLLVWRHDNDEAELRAKLKDWGYKLGRLIKEAGLKPGELKSEFKADSTITIHGKKFRMGGRIDVLLKTKTGDYIFFDLKASANKAIMDIDQIVWYATLLGIYLGDHSQPKAGGYFLPGIGKEGSIKMYTIPESSKVAMINRIASAMELIESKVFKAVPEDSKCFWCAVKHACPAIKQTPHTSGALDLGDLT